MCVGWSPGRNGPRCVLAPAANPWAQRCGSGLALQGRGAFHRTWGADQALRGAHRNVPRAAQRGAAHRPPWLLRAPGCEAPRPLQ